MNRAALYASLAVASGCAGPHSTVTWPGAQRVPARIVEATSGQEVPLDTMLERLAGADVVFLGETHVDETTHRLELAVYEGLIERTGGKVVLAMEMFSRDAQPLLDAYVAKEIDEPEFLADASPWGNYRTGYRPLVELARERGLPVVGSNAPADLRRKVSRGGADAYGALTEEERAWMAPELHPGREEYWERYVRVVRGHQGQSTDPDDYLYAVQNLWDNTMAFSCAEALERRPGWVVLHVNGRFHSDYGQGTVDQLRLRAPDARIAVVTATPVDNLAALDVDRPVDVADYVAFVDARARGTRDGMLAVRASRELRYELRVPKGAGDDPLPLLVWLAGDGLRAEDALAFWEIALRDEAIVAVLEPPYRGVQEDLSMGGRWVWSETLSDDVSSGVAAAREVRRYLSSYYGVDAERVVLGGEGSGATVAAAAALFGDAERAVALLPRDFRRLRLHGLPEPGGPERQLTLMVDAGDREWWQKEVDDYGPSGLAGSFAADGDASLLAAEEQVRSHLGLAAVDWRSALGAPVGEAMRDESPAHRAFVATRDRATLAGVEVPDLDALAELLASGAVSGKVLPAAEGPFGGTTVVVLSPDSSETQRTAWLGLEGSDVLRAHGPFQRLRVAVQGGEPSLDTVLGELHRSNVLIVPAALCEDAEFMRELRAACGDHLDEMTAVFRPGLGVRLHLAYPERL